MRLTHYYQLLTVNNHTNTDTNIGADVDKILSLGGEESYSFIKPNSSDTDDDASSKKVFGLDGDFLKKIRNWNPANLRGFNDNDSKRTQSADGGLLKTNRDNYYSNSNNSSSNSNESNIIPMSISEVSNLS